MRSVNCGRSWICSRPAGRNSKRLCHFARQVRTTQKPQSGCSADRQTIQQRTSPVCRRPRARSTAIFSVCFRPFYAPVPPSASIRLGPGVEYSRQTAPLLRCLRRLVNRVGFIPAVPPVVEVVQSVVEVTEIRLETARRPADRDDLGIGSGTRWSPKVDVFQDPLSFFAV